MRSRTAAVGLLNALANLVRLRLRPCDHRTRSCTPQFFMGLAVLVTGVVFLLLQPGRGRPRPYLGYWPWLLMPGAPLARARSVPSALIGVFWIALAVWLKPRLFGVDLSVLRTYWPVILIFSAV